MSSRFRSCASFLVLTILVVCYLIVYTQYRNESPVYIFHRWFDYVKSARKRISHRWIRGFLLVALIHCMALQHSPPSHSTDLNFCESAHSDYFSRLFPCFFIYLQNS